MSDGNFNRSLLPHTPYHSGLQTGKSIARMQAIKAFKHYLFTSHPELKEKELAEQIDIFNKLLSRYL